MKVLHKIFPAAHLVISVLFIACALVLIFFAVTELWRAEAVALFCYQVRKWIGSFAAALGGLDTLVFAGGIGDVRRWCAPASATGWDFSELSSMKNEMRPAQP